MNAWLDPAPLIYRYSVKCDRERSLAIDRAARKAGVSVERFVQDHFERILDRQDQDEPATQSLPAEETATREERLAAESAGLTVGALRVLRAVIAAEDDCGKAQIGVGTIAARTGFTDGSVRVLLTKLVAAGHLTRISNGGWRRTTIYRIVRRPD